MLPWHRKYRPGKVEELDQARVREFLEGILKSGKVSAAYLFSGPKGTGKTSAARILAKILNCETNKASLEANKQAPLKEPCGVCASCKAISLNSSVAVAEIDAASNRGIDDIRELRERVSLMPTDGSLYSVYIIDEVHMLTTEAFNALLKTLEEPPQHVVFCLCTTEEHKLPGTIISRCVKVSYAKSNSQEIARSLGRIITAEKLEISDEALNLVAQKADGSFRDAVVMLEQLAVHSPITAEIIETNLGQSSQELVRQFVDQLLAAQTTSALENIQGFNDSGVRMKLISQQVLLEAMERLRQAVKNHDSQATGQLTDLVEIFSKTFARFAEVPIESIPLEMAVVEFCLKHSTSSSSSGSTPPPRPTPIRVSSAVNKANSTQEIKASPAKVLGSEPAPQLESPLSETDAVPQRPTNPSSLELSAVKSQWRTVLKNIAQENHGLVTLLQKAQVVDCRDSTLHLGVSYSFHKQQLEQDRYSRIIEDVMSEMFGGMVRLVVQVTEQKAVPKALKNHENVTGQIKKQDEDLVNAVEEAFGL